MTTQKKEIESLKRALKQSLTAFRGIYETLEDDSLPYARRVDIVLANDDFFPLTEIRETLAKSGCSAKEIRELK